MNKPKTQTSKLYAQTGKMFKLHKQPKKTIRHAK